MSIPHDDLAAKAAEARQSARRAVREAIQRLSDVQRSRAQTAGRRRAIDLRDVYPPGTAPALE